MIVSKTTFVSSAGEIIYFFFQSRCEVPEPPEIPDARPTDRPILYWSNKEDWKGTPKPWGGANAENIPQDGKFKEKMV